MSFGEICDAFLYVLYAVPFPLPGISFFSLGSCEHFSKSSSKGQCQNCSFSTLTLHCDCCVLLP